MPRTQTRHPVLLAALALATAIALPARAAAHDRELVLAGGSLHLCSSLAPRDCRADAGVTGTGMRGESRYRVDATGIEDARTLPLRVHGSFDGAARTAWLQSVRAAVGDGDAARDALVDALRGACVAGGVGRRCRGGHASPWERMDDASRAALLSAFERPQLDARGARLRERASLDGSRDDAGPSILRAFVERASLRSPGQRPRVAVVTASAGDPFDPVDVYLDALRQAGAEPEWWPLDAAVAAALRAPDGCAALPALRRSVLQQAGRERVFADLAARQQAACTDVAALTALPDRVQGVFFTGGDQWRLRRAFVDDAGAPLPWLATLRAAVARGDVVIGGTSAGSAVQSGGPMLGNGTSAQALRDGAHAADPPVPGCTRAKSCGALHEDALTWSPAGLALAPGLVVDTHFSERGRELRLLELLAATEHPRAIGVDETSALHLRWSGDGLVLRALGANGGWAMDASPGCEGRTRVARMHYLAPGVDWRWEDDGRMTALGALPPVAMHDAATAPPGDALADGALRAAARAIAEGRAVASQRAGDARASLVTTPETRAWTGERGTGITGLRLALSPARGCAVR